MKPNNFEDQPFSQQQALGDVQIQGDDNIFNVIQGQIVTLNQTKIIQISVDEIKTRPLILTSPYKGLKKFEPEDKDQFFGRDQFLTELVNQLEHTNLILLLGASGSGKSSLVRAGLIPWLSRKFGVQLADLIFTPDQDPFESLYISLRQSYMQADVAFVREARIDTWTQLVDRVKGEAQWFILIDQFEELFTVSQPGRRDRFLESLLQLNHTLLRTKNNSVKIVATMRADFLDRLSPYPRLVKATDLHRPFMAEMQQDELRLAIEQPAAQHGVIFETGLVEEIIKDVQGQAGYLPLLQYTLNLFWTAEVKATGLTDRLLKSETYRRLGGVRGALQQHVDLVYSALSASEQLAAKQIFLKLVEIGQDTAAGTGWQPVRRRALRSEFSDKTERQVLSKLIDENLLISTLQGSSNHPIQTYSSRPMVEIAHEVLLTSWAQLNDWIQQNRQAITDRNRIYGDFQVWQTTQSEEDLLRGSLLERALELRDDATFQQVLNGFDPTTNQFINTSASLRDQRRQREIKRNRTITIASIAVASVISILGIFAYTKQREASTNAEQWQQQVYKTQEESTKAELEGMLAAIRGVKQQLNSNPQLDDLLQALKLKQQYDQLAVKPQAIEDQFLGVLAWATNTVQERNNWAGEQGIVRRTAFSPNGELLATVGDQNTIKIWDAVSGRPIDQIELQQGKDKQERGIAFSPDADRTLLAAIGKDGTVELWQVSTDQGATSPVAKIRTEKLRTVNFSPDGDWVLTGDIDGNVKIWDLSGQLISTIRTGQQQVNHLVFSPSNPQLLTTAGEDGTAKVWELADLSPSFSAPASSAPQTITKPVVTIATGHAAVKKLVFSPDGQTLVTAGGEDKNQDDTVKFWNSSGKPITTVRTQQGAVISLAWNQKRDLLATAGRDGSVVLWSASGEPITKFITQQGIVWDVAFSPEGDQVATAGRDQTIRLWSTGERAESPTHLEKALSIAFDQADQLWQVTAEQQGTLQLWNGSGSAVTSIQRSGKVNRVAIHPDSQTLATAGNDGMLDLWSFAGEHPKAIRMEQKNVQAIAFSMDGQRIATGDSEGTVKLWDREGMQLNSEPLDTQQEITGVAFSRNGTQLATAGKDGTIKLWNITNLASISALRTIKSPYGSVYGLAFSPNDRLLATGGIEGRTSLWSVAEESAGTDPLLATFGIQPKGVTDLAFSSDGKQLATRSETGLVKLWQIGGTEELLSKSCLWLKDYLQHSTANVNQADRSICEGV